MMARPSSWFSQLAAIRRIAIAAIAAVTLLIAGSLLLRVARPDDNAAAIVSPSSMTIDAPTEIVAGDQIEVRVIAPVADRTDVTLGVFGAVETTLLEAVASRGAANFVLESDLLDHAGRLTLVAEVGATRTSHELMIAPGRAVDPVVPLVGPRTIVADGEDLTMIVVSPTDAFGNPLPDGTPLTTQVVRPDGTIETLSPIVERGIAASILTATTQSGRVSITSSVGDQGGPANVVDQVAGLPDNYSLETIGTNDVVDQLFADGFTPFEVSTSQLRDAFGNLMPDGVIVTFSVDSPDGTSFAPATIQGGYATVTLEAPSYPGDVVIRARTSGSESAALALSFAPAVVTLDVASFVAPDGTTGVEIGPVLTVRGGYPADGTLVTVRRTAGGDLLATSSLYQGFATLPLRTTAADTITIEILGAQKTLTFEEAD